MKIGGFQKLTLSDFPGRIAAIVFTQGCNFRCPYCHNAGLIPLAEPSSAVLVPEGFVLDYIRRLAGRLDGIVVTGGEPTIHDDLPGFLRAIRNLGGLRIKLDTNGSRPEMIRRLIREGLVDYIAMDIKGPPQSYHRYAGVPVPASVITESMAAVAGSGIEHEFRTTVVKQLLSASDIETVAGLVPPGSRHTLQGFLTPPIPGSQGEPVWKRARSSASGAYSTNTTTPPVS